MRGRRVGALVILVAFAVLVTGSMSEATRTGRHSTIVGGSHVEKGSGHLTTEQRDIGAFTWIESNIGADISVSIGSSRSVNLVFDDNLISYVSTKVRGKKLIVEADRSFSSFNNCHLDIVIPQLEGVSVGGSGKIEINGLDADRFEVEIDGSADIEISGETGELDVEVNGSGNVDTRDLVAGEANVEINGSGNVEVMARDYLTAVINGSGDISYYGNPGQVVKRVEGSGRIRHRR